MVRLRLLLCAVALAATGALPAAQSPIEYVLTFPEREHRQMHVQITFTGVPAGPLQLRMSRTSPGRYALHEFAKNVFDVRITDRTGRPLPVVRPNLHQWDVSGHDGTVLVGYRVFGDRVDGTYLAIDTTHAHINMPAALMWARGLELRPSRVRFEAPAGSSWRVATQLLPGDDPYTFTAPNLQYLMDSPAEVSAFSLRTFSIPDGAATPMFRLAVHHSDGDAELTSFAGEVERIVRETRNVFGEFPSFEGNTYTFIADYLPWVDGDAMEHRNSTVLTSSGSLRRNRMSLLDSVAHEFFHAWNVERIRPRAVEPFDLEAASMVGDLWFGEGFTNYYGPLVMTRAGLLSAGEFAADMGRAIETVVNAPGRRYRSAVEMSELAPFVDAATSIDATNLDNTHVSYYAWGQVIALSLDLTLRTRSSGRLTLDDYMRALWSTYGKPAAKHPGHVAVPYTRDDLRRTLAAVARDEAFATEFFGRYIEGREVMDLAPLLERAGLRLRRAAPGRAYAGQFAIEDSLRGARVAGLVPDGSPAYLAGLERGDVILSIDGVKVTRAGDVDRALGARAPGDQVPIVFERRGQPTTSTLRLVADPRLDLIPAEQAGQTLTDAQRQFRSAWLSSRSRNAF